MTIALRIEAAPGRALREGVPRLLEILGRHGAGATFLFALGPEGAVLRRKNAQATDGALLRRVRSEGFETGVLAWNIERWKRGVEAGDAMWTAWEMGRAVTAYRNLFEADPPVHGAPGWRMNVHAFRRTQSLGFAYASDTRGTHPFLPVVHAEIVACPQFPTTLPLLEEIIREGTTLDDAPAAVLARTEAEAAHHVFTFRPGRDASTLEPFERLLAGWKIRGREIVSLGRLAENMPASSLPLHTVVESPGATGPVAIQGPPFLAASTP